MSDARVAWLHKANDNYYTDEQFQAETKINSYMERSYIKFVEHSAFEALRKQLEDVMLECASRNKQLEDVTAEREKWAKLAVEFRDECAAQDKENEERSKEYQSLCVEMTLLKVTMQFETMANTKSVYNGTHVMEMHNKMEAERDFAITRAEAAEFKYEETTSGYFVELTATREKLALCVEALEWIIGEVGTSSLANKIAHAALEKLNQAEASAEYSTFYNALKKCMEEE